MKGEGGVNQIIFCRTTELATNLRQATVKNYDNVESACDGLVTRILDGDTCNAFSSSSLPSQPLPHTLHHILHEFFPIT